MLQILIPSNMMIFVCKSETFGLKCDLSTPPSCFVAGEEQSKYDRPSIYDKVPGKFHLKIVYPHLKLFEHIPKIKEKIYQEIELQLHAPRIYGKPQTPPIY